MRDLAVEYSIATSTAILLAVEQFVTKAHVQNVKRHLLTGSWLAVCPVKELHRVYPRERDRWRRHRIGW